VDSEGPGWPLLVRRHAPAMWRVASAVTGPDAATGIVVDAFRRLAGEDADPGPRADLRLAGALLAAVRAVVPRDGVVPISPAGDASLFLGDDDRWAGCWITMPAPWRGRAAGATDLTPVVASAAREALASLRYDLRLLLTLRDREGWSSADVCEALGIEPEVEHAQLDAARWHVLRRLGRELDAAPA
jgi:hypothetical protein